MGARRLPDPDVVIQAAEAVDAVDDVRPGPQRPPYHDEVMSARFEADVSRWWQFTAANPLDQQGNRAAARRPDSVFLLRETSYAVGKALPAVSSRAGKRRSRRRPAERYVPGAGSAVRCRRAAGSGCG